MAIEVNDCPCVLHITKVSREQTRNIPDLELLCCMGSKENKLSLVNENKLFQLVYVRSSHCVTEGPISAVGMSMDRERMFVFHVFYIGIVHFPALRYPSLSTATISPILESPL